MFGMYLVSGMGYGVSGLRKRTKPLCVVHIRPASYLIPHTSYLIPQSS